MEKIESLNQEIHNAFEIIQQGGIILYTTDTVWGIRCDATNPEGVAKIYTQTKSLNAMHDCFDEW
jgi:L-threonylcarbamoyladenylate synthase